MKTPTCEVIGCRHDVWSRNFCALHFAEHFPDIEGRVTPQKKDLKVTIKQNLRKVYATKKSHFGFGRKFISSEAQLVIAMLKDVTTAHKGKEVAKLYSEIIIKTFAKAQSLHEQGILVGQDEKAQHEFNFLRTSMCELVLRLLHVLKGSISLMIRRVADTDFDNTIEELFALSDLEEHCKRLSTMMLPLLSSKLRPKNVESIMEIVSYYGGAEFWVFFTGRRDWEDRRTLLINLLYVLLEPLLAYKCLDERCLKGSLPPLAPFRGSPFCAVHHLELIGSALKWFQMPGPDRVDRSRDWTIPPPADAPPPLISFKKFVHTECPNKEFYFTMHRILIDYKDCKDPKTRITKAVRIIKTHLQQDAIEPLIFPSPEMQEEILHPLLAICKAQQFTQETFFPLWIMIVHELNLVFQQFLQSKQIKETIFPSLLIPPLILSRYGPKLDEGWCFKKLGFSNTPPLERPPTVFDGDEEEPTEDPKLPDDPEELAEDTDVERYEFTFHIRRRHSRSMLRGGRKAPAPSTSDTDSPISSAPPSPKSPASATLSSSTAPASEPPAAKSPPPPPPVVVVPSDSLATTATNVSTSSTDVTNASTTTTTTTTATTITTAAAADANAAASASFPTDVSTVPTDSPTPEEPPVAVLPTYSYHLTTEGSFIWSTDLVYELPPRRPARDPSQPSTAQLLGELARAIIPPGTRAAPKPEKKEGESSGPPPPPPSTTTTTTTTTTTATAAATTTSATTAASTPNTISTPSINRASSAPSTSPLLTSTAAEKATGNHDSKVHKILGYVNQIRRGSGGHTLTPNGPPEASSKKVTIRPKSPSKSDPANMSHSASLPTPLSLGPTAKSSSFPPFISTNTTTTSVISLSSESIMPVPTALATELKSRGDNGTTGPETSIAVSGADEARHRAASDYAGDPYRGSGDEEKLGERRRSSWDISDTRLHHATGQGIGRSTSAPVINKRIELEKRGEANVLRRPSSCDAFDKRDRAQSILNEELFLSKIAEDTFRMVEGDDSDDDSGLILASSAT